MRSLTWSALVGTIAVTAGVSAAPQSSTGAQIPPVGRLVDIGGRRLHQICSGAGLPTVVIENGAGSFAVEWVRVQAEVAKFTAVCSYDRAGYAWSDPGPTQDTVEQTVDPRPGAGRPDQEPLDRLPPELQRARYWAFEKLVRDVGLLPKGIAAAESWRQEFTALRRQRLAEAHPLGDLPLIALERSADVDATWHAQQGELAALSGVGKRIQVSDSGHMIHLYKPVEVAAAIREVVTAASQR